MTPEDAEEYTHNHESIGSGWWRGIALGIRLGVPEAMGLTNSEWRSRIGSHLKLDIEERQEAVIELKAEGFSNRETAAILGVNPSTVDRTVNAANAAPEPETAAIDQGKAVELAAFAAPPKSSNHKKLLARLGKMQNAIHEIIDNSLEALDHHEAAEIIIGLESVREQVEFALISMRDHYDD